ncbi:MAG: AAA-like domain-containing protein [Deltaproteobacteria bacterium]|nr:AAA-like domain-containing protein [Deltaproteobacteria bacterium]
MDDVDRIARSSAKTEFGGLSGTGYFAARGWLVTCAHCVGSATTGTVTPADGTPLEATVVDCDLQADIALVRVDKATAEPLALKPLENNAGTWLAYGFPSISNRNAFCMVGNIRLRSTRDHNNEPALQLVTDDVAGGRGDILQAFSGAAIVCAGRVVGHLKSVLSEEKETKNEMWHGVIYAAPIERVIRLLNKHKVVADHVVRRPPRSPKAAYQPTWYVARPDEESLAIGALESGTAVIITGPESFGKTAMIRHILGRLADRELDADKRPRIALVDLGMLGISAATSIEEILKLLFVGIAQGLEIDPAVLSPHLARISKWGPPMALDLIEDAFLDRIQQPIVIALERAEALVDFPPWSTLVNMLRAWASRNTGEWERFRLILEFSTRSRVVSEKLPDFNTSERIHVDYFTFEQARTLADLYGLDLSDTEIAQIMSLFGGHPYLLRLAMYETARRLEGEHPPTSTAAALGEILNGAGKDGGVFHA